MLKPTLLLSAFLALSGWFQGRDRPITLASGRITLERFESGETVLRIEGESDEPLGKVQVLAPDGKTFLRFEAPTANSALTGFATEVTEETFATLRAACSEGEYEIRATTTGGRQALGRASLSFEMPNAPQVVFPPHSAVGVPRSLVVRWLAEPGVSGYYVELEQGDNDGLAVTLPPGRTSFRIPTGFLAPGAETHLEVAAIGPNGNRSVVEVPFTTR